MRIIAGEFRHRLLLPPPEGATTRPMPDRVKESVFGLLRGHFEGAAVGDFFAGTGAVGLEAISRGASRCVFVERDRATAGVLERNVRTLGVEDRCEVVCGDALGAGALARMPRPLDLAFFDPPYALVEDPVGFRRAMVQLAAIVGLLAADGFAVLRTPWPLRHAEGPVPAAQAEPARTRRPRRESRGDWRRDLDAGERARPVGVEDDTINKPAPPAPVRRIPADLGIPGAVGPETHVYRAMAVHLYMRKRA